MMTEATRKRLLIIMLAAFLGIAFVVTALVSSPARSKSSTKSTRRRYGMRLL